MFFKAIASGKEHRKPYRGSKAKDWSCKNHGSCGWCVDNRTFFDRKMRKFAEDEMNEYLIYKKV